MKKTKLIGKIQYNWIVYLTDFENDKRTIIESFKTVQEAVIYTKELINSTKNPNYFYAHKSTIKM